jgi:hypothetical protein
MSSAVGTLDALDAAGPVDSSPAGGLSRLPYGCSRNVDQLK